MKEIDIVDFAEKYLGIRLFEYQKMFMRSIQTKREPIFYKPCGGLDLRMLEYCCNALLTKEDICERIAQWK